MKTIKIYEREILERTRFREYRYKQVKQVIILYNNIYYNNDHYQELNNPRLKIPFKEVLNTRSTKKAQDYINMLGKSDADKWIKETLKKLLNI